MNHLGRKKNNCMGYQVIQSLVWIKMSFLKTENFRSQNILFQKCNCEVATSAVSSMGQTQTLSTFDPPMPFIETYSRK